MAKLVPVPSSFKVVMILTEAFMPRAIGDFLDVRASGLALLYQAKADFFGGSRGNLNLN